MNDCDTRVVGIQFELLSEDHVQRLYEFEQANRIWFESLIAPRGDDFYSPEGVSAHVAECAAYLEAGRLVPYVLVDGDSIVARANLKDINLAEGTAEVGYRVAEERFGQGLASRYLAQLVTEAQGRMVQCRLWGRVLDNNPASRRVLEKQGFAPVAYQPDFTEIRGHILGCTVMERKLSPGN